MTTQTDKATQELVNAADEVLRNIIDSGAYGPDEFDVFDLQFPVDEDGDRWFPDVWNLKQALAAFEN